MTVIRRERGPGQRPGTRQFMVKQEPAKETEKEQPVKKGARYRWLVSPKPGGQNEQGEGCGHLCSMLRTDM